MKRTLDTNLAILIQIFISFACFFFVMWYSPSDIDVGLKISAKFGLAIIIINVILWYKVSGTLISTYGLFAISFYSFCFAQSVLYAFDIEFTYANVYFYTSHQSLFTAQQYCIICFSLLQLGALFARRKNDYKFWVTSEEVGESEQGFDFDSFCMTGKILLLITIIPAIYAMITFVIDYRLVGYAASSGSSGSTSWEKLFDYVAEIFPAALVMINLSSKDCMKRISFWIMITWALLYFYCGERTSAIGYLFGAILCNNYCKESCILDIDAEEGRNNRRNNFLFVIVGIIVILFIPILGSLRNVAGTNVSSYLGAFSNSSMTDLLANAFATLGYSILPFAKTIEFVPAEQGFAYGTSYLWALTALIPNIFPGTTHIAKTKAGLQTWITQKCNYTSGMGFLIPAEAWYNFGWVGCLMMILIGYAYSRTLAIDSLNAHRASKIYQFVSIVGFIILITTPRRDFLTVVRDVELIILFPLLFYYIIKIRNSHI